MQPVPFPRRECYGTPVIKDSVIIVPNSSTDYELHRLNALDLTLTDEPWPFAAENDQAIAEHWAGCIAANPKLFNGNVLLMSGGGLEDGCFRANLIEVDYASFLTWRDWGWADKSVHDLYGSAIAVSSEGAMVMGRMAAHTVNAGLIYPPGGSLTREDLLEGNKIDLLGSIARELEEEAGLDAHEATPDGIYVASFDQRIAIGQVLRFPYSNDEMERRLAAFLEAETEPELDRIMLINDIRELEGAKMPPHARAFASVVLEGVEPDA